MTQVMSQDCRNCKHKEHDLGKCKQCNCGESEIRRPWAVGKSYMPLESSGDVWSWADRFSKRVRPKTRTEAFPY